MIQKNILRSNLSNHNLYKIELSKKIESFFNELIKGYVVCTYVPIESEVNILPLLKDIDILNTTFMNNGNLQICSYKEPLIKKKNGILEPQNPDIKNDTEVFIVPGLGFTKSGSRLGRGSGHYDKLLYKNQSVLKIGVCHDFQIVDYIPEEEHDISMDYVFTDKNYYKSAI